MAQPSLACIRTETILGWFLNRADPNARLNQRGRYDAGRAFTAHLFIGFVPFQILK